LEDSNRKKGKELYLKYMEEGLNMFPPFKGYGMKVLQFAVDEPEIFREYFYQRSDLTFDEYMDEVIEWKKVLPVIMNSMELNETDAKMLFKNLFPYTQGIASLIMTGSCKMSQEEISSSMGAVCRGLLMQLKSSFDERTKIIPKTDGINDIGDISEYLKGKKDVIVGYGSNKELFQIKLDAILYFEAVGERVFAYTKTSVYEIKMRLYQVEENVKGFSFVRVSKSMLVNVTKIHSLSHESSGRGKITILNGETIVASRSYMSSLSAVLKKAEEP